MHIDRAHQITVSREAAGTADPISAFGFLFLPTARTLATCASFGASEARDASLLRFVREIVDVFAIFPQGHALIMMSASIPIAYAMRIANEEPSHLVLYTKANDLAGGFVAQIADTSFTATTLLVRGTLQLLPATGILGTAGLLLSNFTQVLATLSLEATNTTPGNNQCLACVCGHSRKVDFTEVYGGLYVPWGLFGSLDLDADMQFKAMIPDERAGATLFREVNRQDKRFPSFAHGQDDPSYFFVYCLSRPVDGVEALGTPRIFHLHVGLVLPKFPCGLDVGKKGMHDHLNRLAMECKLPLGGLL